MLAQRPQHHKFDVDDDVLSELLITKLMEEDIQLAQEAEKLQLEQLQALLRSSEANNAAQKGKSSTTVETFQEDDADIAWQLYMKDTLSSSDAAYATSLEAQRNADTARNQQYAQKLAANERKIALDAEFARKLQEMDGEVDMDTFTDAEKLLDRDTINSIMSQTFAGPDKGKGKMKSSGFGQFSASNIPSSQLSEQIGSDISPFQTCGICLEPVQLTYSPNAASKSANSSARVPFGLRLTCPKQHAYCGSCLSQYIRSKLDPADSGQGSVEGLVFPIRCPECPTLHWPIGIEEDVANKVLDEKMLVLWHRQKIFDSLPKIYCPNPKCSALVEADEDQEGAEASCPSCDHVMCVACRVPWHEDLSCEEYQALPPDERSPEDRLLLELAQAKQWRRCPQCKVIVELTQGCNHITCRCGVHFCFKCGALWDVDKVRCMRVPTCELWDENMLLDEQEREREQERGQGQAQGLPAGRNAVIQPPPPPYVPARAYVPPPQPVRAYSPPPQPIHRHNRHDDDDLEWIDNPTVLCSRHWFTTQMIKDLECLYCGAQLQSLNALRYHLSHVKKHPVYACCGRFFKREIDFDRHQESETWRFGHRGHDYTFRNDH